MTTLRETHNITTQLENEHGAQMSQDAADDEVLRVIAGVHEMTTAADEEWKRRQWETDPRQMLSAATIVAAFMPMLIVSFVTAIFFRAVSASVLFLPLALGNVCLLLILRLMLVIEIVPTAGRGYVALVTFTLGYTSLVLLSIPAIDSVFKLVAVHSDTANVENTGQIIGRYVDVVSASLSTVLAALTSLYAYGLRPSDAGFTNYK